MAVIEFVELEGKLELPDGMTSPYSRVLYADPTGRGDFTTIQAAADYAGHVDRGAERASASVVWEIRLGPWDYPEAPTLPEGIALVGVTSTSTRITGGTLTVNGRHSLANLAVDLVAGGSATVGIRVINNTYGAMLRWTNVVSSVDTNTNAIVAAVELNGSVTTTLNAEGGSCYADNDNAGASAVAVSVRMMSGCNLVWEGFGGIHYKTSATGGGKQICLWRQTSNNGFFHTVGDYAAVGGTTAWRSLNEGTNRNIGYIAIACSEGGTRKFIDEDVTSGRQPSFLHNAFAGTYDAPITVRGNKLWVDATGTWRTKATAPASDTDGVRLCPNPTDAGYTNLEVYQSTASVAVAGSAAAQAIVFNAMTTDPRAEYNNGSGVWTASQSGTFMVQAAINRSDSSTGRTTGYIFKNGAEHARFAAGKVNAEATTVLVSKIMVIAAGDTIDVRVNMTSAGTIAGGGANLTWMRIVRMF